MMGSYKLPAGLDDKIADSGHIYVLSFAYDGVVFYHDNYDYDDSSNTVAIVRNGDFIKGKLANDLLTEYIARYVRENGNAFIADGFVNSVAYARSEIENRL